MGKLERSVYCPIAGPNKGTMVAAHPALILAPGNVVFPHKNLARVSDPLPVPQVSIRRSESLCVVSSKGHLGFQSPSVSHRRPESPLIFTVRTMGNSSFLG